MGIYVVSDYFYVMIAIYKRLTSMEIVISRYRKYKMIDMIYQNVYD